MRIIRLGVSALLGVALSLLACGSAMAHPYPDVPPSHPYYTAIEDLAGRGIIGGYTSGYFGPSDPVTRQQFAKMIVLAVGFAVSEKDTHVFSDLPQDSRGLYPYHFAAVAAENGLMTGYGDGSFRPLRHISRMQVISIVVRAAGTLLPVPPDDWQGLLDSSNPVHGPNMRRAEYGGLLAGIKDLAEWDVGDNMTRAEVAEILHSLLVKTAYRPPICVSNYGAKGDGVTDDTRGVQSAIDACPSGGTVDIPAGIFRLTDTLKITREVSVVGTAGESIFFATHGDTILIAHDPRGITLSGLTFRGLGVSSDTEGLALRGAVDVTMKDLAFEDMRCGLFLTGSPGSGLALNGLKAERCVEPFFVSNVSNSAFANIDIQAARLDSNQYHGMYLERSLHNLTFRNVRITGGSGYCLQLYTESGASDHLTFDDVTLDATIGRYPLVIWGFSNVTFHDVRLLMTRTDGPCVRLGMATDVAFSGFTAQGGSALVAPYAGCHPRNVVFRDGSYQGPELGTGATFQDVRLVDQAGIADTSEGIR